MNGESSQVNFLAGVSLVSLIHDSWLILSPLSTFGFYLNVKYGKKVGRVVGKDESTHALYMIRILVFERSVDS